MDDEQYENLIVNVQPNAKQNILVGFDDKSLTIKVAAPPKKGMANKELIAFLSSILNIGKTYVSIVKGLTNKKKIIRIYGISNEKIINSIQSNMKK